MIKMALLVGACFLVSGASVFGILFKSTKDFEGSLAMGLCIGFSYAMVCFSTVSYTHLTLPTN